MYTSFTIENFRLFDRLTVEPLARVNLIVGQNNAGKTALLEALWLHTAPNQPGAGVRLAAFRGITRPDPRRLMHDLFHGFNPDCQIALSAQGDWDGDARMLQINSRPRSIAIATVPVSGATNAPMRGSQDTDVSSVSNTEIVFDYVDENGQNHISVGWWYRSESQIGMSSDAQMKVANEGIGSQQSSVSQVIPSVLIGARHRMDLDEEVERFGNVELEGYSDTIVHCLKSIDGRIERLRTIATDAPPMIYADVGLKRPIPMGLLGDGIGRFLSMALAFYHVRGGMMFVDEIENGIHHSVLVDVWKNLNRLSKKFNVQVFATTHSYECMEAARDAFKEMEDDDLRIHRISRRPDGMKASTYSFEGIDYMLDLGGEMR